LGDTCFFGSRSRLFGGTVLRSLGSLRIAKDLEEAVQIAKDDPRFEDGNWRIEVRPIMKVEGIN